MKSEPRVPLKRELNNQGFQSTFRKKVKAHTGVLILLIYGFMLDIPLGTGNGWAFNGVSNNATTEILTRPERI